MTDVSNISAGDARAAKPTGLRVGEPAPWFTARSSSNPRFHFHTAAGRYIVLGFIGASDHPLAAKALAEIADRRALFDDVKASLFGVSISQADEVQGRVAESLPGVRWFWDNDRELSRLYGAIASNGGASENVSYRPFWVVLDPQLRCVFTAPITATAAVLDFVADAPAPVDHAGISLHAPVLILPGCSNPSCAAA
jgi:peroxiredoxin